MFIKQKYFLFQAALKTILLCAVFLLIILGSKAVSSSASTDKNNSSASISKKEIVTYNYDAFIGSTDTSTGKILVTGMIGTNNLGKNSLFTAKTKYIKKKVKTKNGKKKKKRVKVIVKKPIKEPNALILTNADTFITNVDSFETITINDLTVPEDINDIDFTIDAPRGLSYAQVVKYPVTSIDVSFANADDSLDDGEDFGDDDGSDL